VPRSRRLHKIGLAIVASLAVLLGIGAWLLRVEDIPDELPPIQGDPLALAIPSTGNDPPLRVAELAGKTAFFVVVGPQTGESKEGQQLNRALNRWILPKQTVGYIVGDAEGFGMFQQKIAEIMKHFATEMRYPLYVDFEGSFVKTFALPKGHHGFVVLGPDGSVLERRSGGAEGEDLERIRVMLGAVEPDLGPPAPEFAVGDLDRAGCGSGTPCALVFLAKDVECNEVPGIPDGFDGDDEEKFAKMRDPSIRLVSTAAKAKLEHAKGIVIGALRDVELHGWQQVDAAPAVRTAFGIDDDEAAIVVIDEGGRVAVCERGLVPIYKWGRVADLLGVELDDRRPPKGK
jgi:hypothetical protein